jgi:electron transfer flavoprotein alpha subunit
VRYKIFNAFKFDENSFGEIVNMPVEHKKLLCDTEIIEIIEKTKDIDISEAEIIVAVGRGIKNRNDLSMLIELSELIGGQIACTRPLVEAGWLDPHKQIGLSGRTVKAKLVLAVGISGSVQFAAGMRNSDCIVAINSDKNASIFDIAHYGFVGNLYEIIPILIENIREAK